MSGERIETAGGVREQIVRVLMPTLDEWWCGDHVDHHQHDDDGGPLPCCAEARREQALAQADALASLLAEAEERGARSALLDFAAHFEKHGGAWGRMSVVEYIRGEYLDAVAGGTHD